MPTWIVVIEVVAIALAASIFAVLAGTSLAYRVVPSAQIAIPIDKN